MAVELPGNLLAAIDVPLLAPRALPNNAVEVPTSSFANVLGLVQANQFTQSNRRTPTSSESIGEQNPTTLSGLADGVVDADGGLPDRVVTELPIAAVVDEIGGEQVQIVLGDQATTLIASTLVETTSESVTRFQTTPTIESPDLSVETLSRSESLRYTRSPANRDSLTQSRVSTLASNATPTDSATAVATTEKVGDRSTTALEPNLTIVTPAVTPIVTTASTLVDVPRAATRIPSVLPQPISSDRVEDNRPQVVPNLGFGEIRPPVNGPLSVEGPRSVTAKTRTLTSVLSQELASNADQDTRLTSPEFLSEVRRIDPQIGPIDDDGQQSAEISSRTQKQLSGSEAKLATELTNVERPIPEWDITGSPNRGAIARPFQGSEYTIDPSIAPLPQQSPNLANGKVEIKFTNTIVELKAQNLDTIPSDPTQRGQVTSQEIPSATAATQTVSSSGNSALSSGSLPQDVLSMTSRIVGMAPPGTTVAPTTSIMNIPSEEIQPKVEQSSDELTTAEAAKHNGTSQIVRASNQGSLVARAVDSKTSLPLGKGLPGDGAVQLVSTIQPSRGAGGVVTDTLEVAVPRAAAVRTTEPNQNPIIVSVQVAPSQNQTSQRATEGPAQDNSTQIIRTHAETIENRNPLGRVARNISQRAEGREESSRPQSNSEQGGIASQLRSAVPQPTRHETHSIANVVANTVQSPTQPTSEPTVSSIRTNPIVSVTIQGPVGRPQRATVTRTSGLIESTTSAGQQLSGATSTSPQNLPVAETPGTINRLPTPPLSQLGIPNTGIPAESVVFDALPLEPSKLFTSVPLTRLPTEETSDERTSSNATAKSEFAYLFPATSSAQAPGESKQSPPITQQLETPLVTFARLVQNGSGEQEFQIQLDPAELGPVRIRIVSTDSNIRAEVIVSHEMVRQIVEQQIPELRSRLELNGITLTSWEVSTDSSGRAATNSEQREQHRQTFQDDRQRGMTPPRVFQQTETISSRFTRTTGIRSGTIDVTA